MKVLLTKWWFWAGLVVAGLLIWQLITGGVAARKYLNLALDNLRADQSNVVKVKEEQEKWYESEIAKLNAQITQVQKDKKELVAKKAELAAKVAQLEGEVSSLENQIANIKVGSDPDTVIKSLQRRFPSIRRR